MFGINTYIQSSLPKLILAIIMVIFCFVHTSAQHGVRGNDNEVKELDKEPAYYYDGSRQSRPVTKPANREAEESQVIESLSDEQIRLSVNTLEHEIKEIDQKIDTKNGKGTADNKELHPRELIQNQSLDDLQKRRKELIEKLDKLKPPEKEE